MISKVGMMLLAISEGCHRLSEIAARTGLPLSTVHRLATDLAAWRVLERGADGRFRVGPSLRGTDVAGEDIEPGQQSVREPAVPVMEDLYRALRVRVRVGVLSEPTEVAYVQKDSLHRPVSRECTAARLPAHATALGKALLAFSPPAVVAMVTARRLRAFTPLTLTRPDELNATFRTVRATRFAVSDRELDRDSCAVAVPVFGTDGHAVAAIELQARDLARDVAAWRSTLIVAAGSLSRELAAHRRSARADRPIDDDVAWAPPRLVVGGGGKA
ncbi:MAG: IclR family transcriptional regulator [Pseudonocardia sp.]